MLVSPQHLIDGEVAELRRFGYTPFGDAAPDWAGMWELLSLIHISEPTRPY